MLELPSSESAGQTGEDVVTPRPADDVLMSGGCTEPAAQGNTASEHKNDKAGASETASAPTSEAAGPLRAQAHDQTGVEPSEKGEEPAPERSKFRNKRTPAQVEHDRFLIAELTIKGESQMEIAGRINAGRPPEQHVSRELIRNEIAIIKKGWREESQTAIDDQRAELLQQYKVVNRELWASWEKTGNPKFIALWLANNKEICKLQGLYPSPRAGQGLTAAATIQLVGPVEPAKVLGPPAKKPDVDPPGDVLTKVA